MKPLDRIASGVGKLRLSPLVRRYARRGPGFIAVYHDISSEVLKAHLLALSEDWQFVSMTEMVSRLLKKLPTKRLMAITFDDGLSPVIESAAALAREYSWPMTFYLPTRFIDTRDVPWYLELRPLIERTSQKEIEIDGFRMRIDTHTNRERAIQSLTQQFMAMRSVPDVEAHMERLRTRLYGETPPPDMTLDETVSWDKVSELAQREELTFGAHTVNHLALSRLDSTAIEWEFRTSKERIESITDRSADHFCYPFGGIAEIGENAANLARSIFTSAVTMVRGRCHSDVDLALLPRIPFWTGDSPEVVRLRTAINR